MSSKARKRRLQDIERAEAILERTAVKIEKSKGRSRTIQSRRKAWEDVNKTDAVKPRPKFPTEEDLMNESENEGSTAGDDVAHAEAKGWETDEEMEGADVEAAAGQQKPPSGAPGNAPVTDDLDEIL